MVKVGDKFNKLTVIEVIPIYNGGSQIQCECGLLHYRVGKLKNKNIMKIKL